MTTQAPATPDTERLVETLGGTRALQRRPRTTGALLEQLRQGLPYASLEAVATRFELSQEEIASVLALPPRTLARRKVQRRLRANESDRLFRLGRLAALAEEVLGSREKAARWLHRPNRVLHNQPPLAHLDSDLGARQVEALLVRIAHGVYS